VPPSMVQDLHLLLLVLALVLLLSLPSSSSLNRMEADVAAKAKSRASRVLLIAMSAVHDQESKKGNDIIAKKFFKTGGG